MEIITSHNAIDFDGLACMVAAEKIYPNAVKVFSGTLSKNVKKFMALYKDSLHIRSPKEIDHNKVKKMIVVDTANPSRLGQLKDITNREGIEYYIYDHHPPTDSDLRGSINEIHKVGAATTILVEKIIELDIEITAFDATILALGIYDDTGSLLFSSTTSRDAYAVAFLLQKGANLVVVNNFMEKPFSGEQRVILQDFLDTSVHYNINNTDVVMAFSEMDTFVPGLDLVTYRLFELEDCDIVFTLAYMEDRVHVVARSRTSNTRVNEILKPLGGRGHEKAASAVVKNKTVQEVMGIILKDLHFSIHPAVLARDVMSTPVKTVSSHISMEEVGRIMLRYGHTGMPVVEGDKMIGVISRRDVDKAKLHELGHAPVKGFMTSEVLAVAPDASANEIQDIMVEKDIGRLPIVQDGRLVGIVSRTDILRTLHGEDYPEDYEVLYPVSSEGIENYKEMMLERLPGKILYILQMAGKIADDIESSAYCVGGYVRDLFLQVPNFDVDLVVEGDGKELANRLAESLEAKVRIHERFGTATVILEDGNKIDIATARTEYYEFPAALPRVERSSIKEDMYRRDFTINTLALCLNPDRFGDLIDYFGGRKDLENKCVRILYNLSFVEDPTRILRAIRFEQRYRFSIENDTLRFARDAIERKMLGKLSYNRILRELILILNEKDPLPALNRMVDIGVWKDIFPEINYVDIRQEMLRRIPVLISWWQERYLSGDVRPWLIYFIVMFTGLKGEDLHNFFNRYPLDKESRKAMEDAVNIPGLAVQISREKLLPSQMDEILVHFGSNNLIYLLLCLENESTWDSVVAYLDARENAEVRINGNDLQNMGLKPGPQYKEIFDELYELKLNGVIKDKREEFEEVKKWITEGKFII